MDTDERMMTTDGRTDDDGRMAFLVFHNTLFKSLTMGKTRMKSKKPLLHPKMI